MAQALPMVILDVQKQGTRSRDHQRLIIIAKASQVLHFEMLQQGLLTTAAQRRASSTRKRRSQSGADSPTVAPKSPSDPLALLRDASGTIHRLTAPGGQMTGRILPVDTST